ncbi:MAG: hypothetical protein CO098_02930 [Bacteroidetes bacterium CG_4_9_14_3_um_filter_41_19]|nr:MAG: hypothetical protein CO098_02930 [Bacteroidetes bacterium CG_4_9_14_3_um_filter_41_19]
MSEIINIKLNGNVVSGTKGEYILEVARRNNIKIPTLCHDPRLDPFSSCFVCVVEIEGLRGLHPSCSTRIQPGMNIITDSEKVHQSRQTALDLIMSNHYADCQAPCIQTCPANVDVQGYISLIDKGLYHEAVALIKEVNPLPAICGRVCVRPCEAACRRNLMDEGAPVGIDYMKRFASDWDLESNNHFKPEIAPSSGKKIAIIGAGPGGLSAAYFLQQKGHQCDIFEAGPKPGGWLRYGIPEYRLPNNLLDKEIETITELGANIYCGKNLGVNLSYAEITKEYNATILTIGSQKGTLIGTPGDDAENVYSGIDFLKNMEITGKPADFTGKKIIVVGGGNTAMDCCRTSIRCGSTDVKVVYRRTEKEMPANPIEIHESKLEGVEYLFLNNPVQVNKDAEGKLKSVTLIKMELGEPDASGRRRPVPVEGSETNLEVDIILAAIGQKTDVNFIDDINKYATEGQLAVTRWGDIEANKNTLQTGIPNVFAAGDGVTGPATIIEAIAQAKKAALSCHQFLSGEGLTPHKRPFLSKKDHFKKQIPADYVESYVHQTREEMPTLDPDNRLNFKEVELGYADETVARNEAQRCLECGCQEFLHCDLQKYSDEYGVNQEKFAGDFNEYRIDFSHPYIEIDSNKCILCSRCVRICSELAGDNALGLVNRGFKTYVAPSLGSKLTDTHCQSCGLCIDTCPTGAISENFLFKPGPVKENALEAIDNYGSEGVSMNLMSYKNNFVMRVEGRPGLVNEKGSIGRKAKFGYRYLNSSSRIKTPMLKKGNAFEPITFEEAYELIEKNIKASTPEQTALFAGARLTNEEIYLIQKWARKGIKTPYIANFHYMGRGSGYAINSQKNVPFNQLEGASRIYLFGAELAEDHDYVGFLVNNARVKKGVKVELISTNSNPGSLHKVDNHLVIKDYYSFVKAANMYLVKKRLQNQMYISANTTGFEEYVKPIHEWVLHDMCLKAGVSTDELETWARAYNDEMNAVLVFSEKYITVNTSRELYNLAMITGKLGKTSSGLMPLKEKNNAQGLFDMGAFGCIGTGGVDIPRGDRPKMKEQLRRKTFNNILIFGEDPVGTAVNKSEVTEWLGDLPFMVVQDYFITETAKLAHLILPASFPIESAGSFTNTQKILQQFDRQIEPKIGQTNLDQLISLGKHFDLNGVANAGDVFSEIIGHLPIVEDQPIAFMPTESDSPQRLFNHGCDYLMKRFDDEFAEAFKRY